MKLLDSISCLSLSHLVSRMLWFNAGKPVVRQNKHTGYFSSTTFLLNIRCLKGEKQELFVKALLSEVEVYFSNLFIIQNLLNRNWETQTQFVYIKQKIIRRLHSPLQKEFLHRSNQFFYTMRLDQASLLPTCSSSYSGGVACGQLSWISSCSSSREKDGDHEDCPPQHGRLDLRQRAALPPARL